MSAKGQGIPEWLSVLYWKQDSREKNPIFCPALVRTKKATMPDPAATGTRNVRSERGHVSDAGECLEAEQDGLGETEQV